LGERRASTDEGSREKMQQDRTWLSIVIPAYNEARRLPETLRVIDAYAQRWSQPVELIVVDDGSADGTAEIVRDVAAELEIAVRLFRHAPNRGKGFALKVGFAASRGETILFTDADLATSFAFSDALLAELEHAEMAIGSRKLTGARIPVRQPWLRERMGRAFTFLVRHLIVDVSDVTCGFKAFRGDVGRDLFARCRIYDWSFDAELLHVATEREVRIVEVPVEWRDQEGTKVRLLRDALVSLLGLARIRWNALRGIYGEPEAPSLVPEELSVRSVDDRPAAGTSS
jgi:dolichyl-phosphate beta-glucosyltransferase